MNKDARQHKRADKVFDERICQAAQARMGGFDEQHKRAIKDKAERVTSKGSDSMRCSRLSRSALKYSGR